MIDNVSSATCSSSGKTMFSEWFDIKNKDHLLAYKHYITNKTWPKHFVPADVDVEKNWELELLTRMALEYVTIKTSTAIRQRTDTSSSVDNPPLPFGGQARP